MGVQNTFLVSELLPAGSERANPNFLDQWERVVDLFNTGQWADAYSQVDCISDDPAANCLTKVMDLTRCKPPDDWNGSFGLPAE
jgi:hypothetical protein